MGSLRLLGGLVIAAIGLLPPWAHATYYMESLAHDSFGRMAVYRSAGSPKGVVLLVSDNSGWTPEMADLAWNMADENYLVAGIDAKAYLQHLEKRDVTCAKPAADLAELAHWLEARYGLQAGRHPVLIGYGEGAAWVYAAIAQAPAETFHAAISVDFCSHLAVSKPLCQTENLTSQGDGQTVTLLPSRQVATAWFVFQSQPACAADTAEAFINQVANAKLVSLPVAAAVSDELMTVPEITAVSSPPKSGDEPAWKKQLLALLQWLDPGIAKQVVQANADLGDLPLIEVPVAGDQPMAVMLSGDGGWAALDRGMAAVLAERGIATVGWDALSYFWRARTPDETAKDLKRVLEYYLRTWHKERVLLIGYSFGADVLAFLANRLPPELQRRVDLVAFLGLSDTASFEFHLTDWLGGSADENGLPVVPEVTRLTWTKRVCVYGEEETDSPCPALEKAGVAVLKMTGDHHFDNDYAGIVNHLLRQLTE